MAWRKPANVHEWLGVLARHKKKTLFPMLAVMIIAVLASFAFEREYRAEAKFARQSDLALDSSGNSIIKNNIEPIRRTTLEDLAGKPAIEQLIEDLGLTRGMPHTADGALTFAGQQAKSDMVNKFKERLLVKFQTQSDRVDQVIVSFADPNRDMAPKVANQAVENYLRETRRKLDETLLLAKAFYEKEVERYRALVQDLEAKQITFKMNNAGLLPDDPSSVQNKLIELRSQVTRISQELEVTKSQRAKLLEWIASQPDETVKTEKIPSPVLGQLVTERAELIKALNQHINFFNRTEEHPLVKKTRQQIADLDKRIEETPATSEGTVTREPNNSKILAQQQAETTLGTVTALSRQLVELNDQKDKFEMLDRNFVVVRSEYLRLQRDLAEATDQLKFWETNLNRTTIALKAELGARGVRLTFTQRADVAKPSKPTLLVVLGAAVVLGLMAGAGVLLMAEVTDHSFRSVDQAVDELKLPILGAVTEIATPAEVARRKILSWAVFPAVGVAMLLVLLMSVYLVYLNLEQNQRFEQLRRHPAQVLFEQLGGHGG
jgi:uncharacterized protein involved in exopolysaccharide biosynthesis